MSNVVDLSARRNARIIQTKLETMSAAGLSNLDISVISCSAARAFTDGVLTTDQVIEIGHSCLKYLSVSKHEEEDCTVFHLGRPDTTTLKYGRGLYRKGVTWHDQDNEGIGHNLTNVDDPGSFVCQQVLDLYRALGHQAMSCYGQLAFGVFHYACYSSFHPLHLQIHPERKTVGMLLHDNLNGCDIVLIAELETWLPVQKDWDNAQVGSLRINES